ncbi:unnamed protein product [Leptidea sinapis]|uniref:Uncharacterized protein n=1 Tax=Leptidea sinapis TaxID=189913 RepID=A0A5E4QGK9_9NEOP|nr:unnamed protein product [Leptidea sinapis]
MIDEKIIILCFCYIKAINAFEYRNLKDNQLLSFVKELNHDQNLETLDTPENMDTNYREIMSSLMAEIFKKCKECDCNKDIGLRHGKLGLRIATDVEKITDEIEKHLENGNMLSADNVNTDRYNINFNDIRNYLRQGSIEGNNSNIQDIHMTKKMENQIEALKLKYGPKYNKETVIKKDVISIIDGQTRSAKIYPDINKQINKITNVFNDIYIPYWMFYSILHYKEDYLRNLKDNQLLSFVKELNHDQNLETLDTPENMDTNYREIMSSLMAEICKKCKECDCNKDIGLRHGKLGLSIATGVEKIIDEIEELLEKGKNNSLDNNMLSADNVYTDRYTLTKFNDTRNNLRQGSIEGNNINMQDIHMTKKMKTQIKALKLKYGPKYNKENRVVSSTEKSVQEDEGAKESLKTIDLQLLLNFLHKAPTARCGCDRRDTRENQDIVLKNNFYSLLFNRYGQIGDKPVTDYTRCGCRRPMRDIPRIRKTKNPNKDKDIIRDFNENLDELEHRLRDAYYDDLNTENLKLKKTKGLKFIPKKISKIYKSALTGIVQAITAFIKDKHGVKEMPAVPFVPEKYIRKLKEDYERQKLKPQELYNSITKIIYKTCLGNH